MALNAAGLNVSGEANPNWKGGLLDKTCAQCGSGYRVKRVHAASRYCSLQCVGLSQKGKSRPRGAEGKPKVGKVVKECLTCGSEFRVFPAHVGRQHCCSRKCSYKRRSVIQSGEGNPNWNGGASRLPYPWNFAQISKRIIKRDGRSCRNPDCRGTDPRLTTHHIDYDKTNCSEANLICLCSSCNSRANFDRPKWRELYSAMMQEVF